jgi:hypothetical protein
MADALLHVQWVLSAHTFEDAIAAVMFQKMQTETTITSRFVRFGGQFP